MSSAAPSLRGKGVGGWERGLVVVVGCMAPSHLEPNRISVSILRRQGRKEMRREEGEEWSRSEGR